MSNHVSINLFITRRKKEMEFIVDQLGKPVVKIAVVIGVVAIIGVLVAANGPVATAFSSLMDKIVNLV
jgi:hypothetical protein